MDQAPSEKWMSHPHVVAGWSRNRNRLVETAI
jgi:hypothetical protein